MLPLILGGISALGSIFGKSGEKRAEGRAAEAQLNTQRDQITSDNFRATLQALLGQRQQELSERDFALNAPSTKLSQLVRGSLLQNVQDPSINVPGLQKTTISGGLRPSSLGAEAREGGGAMVQQALQSLLKGEQFSPMALPNAPGLTPLPQSGKLDSLFNILGTAGSAAGAVAPFLKQQPKASPGIVPQMPITPSFR